MSNQHSTNWVLDPRLEADTILMWTADETQFRLMNDKRWPWIILVPVIADPEDIDDMPADRLAALAPALQRTSIALKAMGVCTSTNVATIGNVVRQMHWHVVGRNEGDANWPAPVWGYGKVEPYTPQEAEDFIQSFRKAYCG